MTLVGLSQRSVIRLIEKVSESGVMQDPASKVGGAAIKNLDFPISRQFGIGKVHHAKGMTARVAQPLFSPSSGHGISIIVERAVSQNRHSWFLAAFEGLATLNQGLHCPIAANSKVNDFIVFQVVL